MSEPADLPIFLAADQRHALALRVISYMQTTEFEKDYAKIEKLIGRDGMFRVAGYKAFMDGSLGSRTAYMHEPFSDAKPDTKYPRGLRSGQATDLAAFAAQVRWAHDHKLQMAIHAIGDEANHELLDMYEGLPDQAARRHRIEHAQHLLPEDIARFAKLGVVASMQPLHKADDGRWAEALLGPQRAQTTYAFNSLLDAQAAVCFGSDCPVVTANPFLGIAAACTARTFDGKEWVPEQSITREQALRAYTVAPPYAVFDEQNRGKLTVGMLADFAILDRDVVEIDADALGDTEAWLTVVNGAIVYRAPR
jgi:predicted amidohydrolase YtcJ